MRQKEETERLYIDSISTPQAPALQGQIIIVCDVAREGDIMEERYKTAIRDLLGAISNDEYLKKIYTLTVYYANRETLENIEGVAK